MSTKILQCCLKSICIYNVRRQYQRERERVCDGESGSRHTGKFEVRKRASLEISQSTCLAECCTTVPTTTTHGTAESSLTLSLSAFEGALARAALDSDGSAWWPRQRRLDWPHSAFVVPAFSIFSAVVSFGRSNGRIALNISLV